MSALKLKVSGMSCGLCVSLIERALHEIGIRGEVDLASGTVTVTRDDDQVPLQKIHEAIEKSGYEVTSSG